MSVSFTHVIVGPSSWQSGKSRYRRDRLTEFICNQNSADKVIWVYPVTATPRFVSSYKKALTRLNDGTVKYDDKLYSLGLPDLIPGRYGKMHNIFSSSNINKLKIEIEKLQNKKILWYTTPAYPYLSGVLQWDRIIYDCSDLWSAPRGVKDKIFSKLERSQIKKAEDKIAKSSDLIFATSDFLAQEIQERLNRKAIIVENGVDLEIFKLCSHCNKDLLADIPKPRFGFIGGMKGKINFSLVKKMADTNPAWSIVLVGPLSSGANEFNDLLGCKNVYWMGEVESGEVPHYIKSFDVGIMPYKEIEYNKAVFPLKFYEYLAAGIPVVGCGLPSTNKYSFDGVYKHVQTEAFIDACTEVIGTKMEISAINKRIELARESCWNDKFTFMYAKACEALY
jgi:teichuronic acid biosynthesis glycosyltransferase TuaH